MRRPGGGASAPELGAVDQVVVDEGRHVNELDRDAGRDRGLAVGWAGEEDKRRPEPLSACRERLGSDLRDEPAVTGDRLLESLLELVEVLIEPGRAADRGEGAHAASPTWSATMPPASSR